MIPASSLKPGMKFIHAVLGSSVYTALAVEDRGYGWTVIRVNVRYDSGEIHAERLLYRSDQRVEIVEETPDDQAYLLRKALRERDYCNDFDRMSGG